MNELRKLRTQNANAECRKREPVGRRLPFSRFCIRILRSRFLWALVLLPLLAACSKKEEEAQPIVSVRVAKAEIAPIAQPIELVGTIAARQEATIASKIGGQIAHMALLKNRVVRAGEVLARIEARDVAAQRAEAAAAVTTVRDATPPAQAALETARRTSERRKELYAKGGISKKDVEASELDVANAAGALKTANSKVAEAETHLASFNAQLGYAEVRAPFDGVVTEQFLRQGDFAQAGQKLLTVADTSTVIVKAPLSDEQAARVHTGDAVTIRPDAGTTLQGRVDLVGRSADAQSRAVELWVTLPNQDGRLRANSAGRVTVASAGVANAVVVPTAGGHARCDERQRRHGHGRRCEVDRARSPRHHRRARARADADHVRLARRRDGRDRRQLRPSRRDEGPRSRRHELGRFVSQQSRAVLLSSGCSPSPASWRSSASRARSFRRPTSRASSSSPNNGVAPAQQTLVAVTRPIEEAMSGIPGIARIRSVTARGASEIDLFFDWRTDIMPDAADRPGAGCRSWRRRCRPARGDRARRPPDVRRLPDRRLQRHVAEARSRHAAQPRRLTIRPPLARIPGVASVTVPAGRCASTTSLVDPRAAGGARALAAAGRSTRSRARTSSSRRG